MNKQALIEQCEAMISNIDKLEMLKPPVAEGFIKNREIARIALAALTAEPVALSDSRPAAHGGICWIEKNKLPHGTKLYTAPPAASAVPDGYVVAPEKANIAMIRAGGKAARQYLEEHGGNSPQVIYQAMLAAAPSPAEGE